MSIDEKAEQALYQAIANVAQIPRPKERERICKEALRMMSTLCGWDTQFTEKP